ncbi:hypothetical protein ABPG74_018667 [Tetrahymena malaccensis]
MGNYCASIKNQTKKKNNKNIDSTETDQQQNNNKLEGLQKQNNNGGQKLNPSQQKLEISIENTENQFEENKYQIVVPQNQTYQQRQQLYFSQNQGKNQIQNYPLTQTVSDEQMQEQNSKYNYPLNQDIVKNEQKNKYTQPIKIECPFHQNQNIELLNMSESIEQKLYCYKCQYGKKYDEEQQKELNYFFQISDKEYLDTFLKFSDPQTGKIFQTWIEKEQELFKQKDQLSEIRIKINQCIDTQIQKINDSMNQLKEQQTSLNEAYKRCNKLTSFQESLSQISKASDLEKSIKELIKEQQKNNQKFELDLKQFVKSVEKEADKQNEILKDTLQQFQKLIPNILNSELSNYLAHFCLNINLDVELFQKVNDYDKSFLINKVSDNAIQIKTSQDSSYDCYYYLNHILNDNKQYEILLDMNKNNPENYIIFYLYNKDQQDTYIIYYKKGKESSYPQIKVEKGVNIVSYPKQSIENMKLQICLKDHIFKCKFGKNICSVQNWSNFQQGKQYYLAIYVHSGYSPVEIKIKYFKEANNLID